jgi:hypothetical protein
MEHKTSFMLVKCSASELHPQSYGTYILIGKADVLLNLVTTGIVKEKL